MTTKELPRAQGMESCPTNLNRLGGFLSAHSVQGVRTIPSSSTNKSCIPSFETRSSEGGGRLGMFGESTLGWWGRGNIRYFNSMADRRLFLFSCLHPISHAEKLALGDLLFFFLLRIPGVRDRVGDTKLSNR